MLTIDELLVLVELQPGRSDGRGVIELQKYVGFRAERFPWSMRGLVSPHIPSALAALEAKEMITMDKRRVYHITINGIEALDVLRRILE